MAEQYRDSAYVNLPIRPVSILEVLCARPDCYTPHGTFDEMASFILGMCFGLQGYVEPTELEEIVRFDKWLQQNVSLGMHAWSSVIRRDAADDDSAFKKLVEHFRAFQADSRS